MKILMIGDSVYPDTMGGSHRHIYDISTALAKQGHDITVFSPKPTSSSKDEEIFNGFRIERYRKRKNKLLSFIDFITGPFCLFYKNYKKGNVPDIIHGHWPLTVFLIFLFIKVKKIPVKLVYTFHGPAYEEYKIELRQNALAKYIFLTAVRSIEHKVLCLADTISTASAYMKRKAISLYGNGDKISVTPHFVDTEKFRIAKDKDFPGLFQNSKKYVISIRRLKKRMGLQLLIKAFSILLKMHPECELLIGGKGDFKLCLEEQAKELGIENKVHFLGFIPDDDLKYYYSKSNVCVVPSQDLEGFGLTTAEAMACGIPVVATNRCANPELLRNITPELLTEYDASDMAKKIEVAISNHYNPDKLRNYILDNFNINNTIKGYLNLYHSK